MIRSKRKAGATSPTSAVLDWNGPLDTWDPETDFHNVNFQSHFSQKSTGAEIGMAFSAPSQSAPPNLPQFYAHTHWSRPSSVMENSLSEPPRTVVEGSSVNSLHAGQKAARTAAMAKDSKQPLTELKSSNRPGTPSESNFCPATLGKSHDFQQGVCEMCNAKDDRHMKVDSQQLDVKEEAKNQQTGANTAMVRSLERDFEVTKLPVKMSNCLPLVFIDGVNMLSLGENKGDKKLSKRTPASRRPVTAREPAKPKRRTQYTRPASMVSTRPVENNKAYGHRSRPQSVMSSRPCSVNERSFNSTPLPAHPERPPSVMQ